MKERHDGSMMSVTFTILPGAMDDQDENERIEAATAALLPTELYLMVITAPGIPLKTRQDHSRIPRSIVLSGEREHANAHTICENFP